MIVNNNYYVYINKNGECDFKLHICYLDLVQMTNRSAEDYFTTHNYGHLAKQHYFCHDASKTWFYRDKISYRDTVRRLSYRQCVAKKFCIVTSLIRTYFPFSSWHKLLELKFSLSCRLAIFRCLFDTIGFGFSFFFCRLPMFWLES